MNSTRGTSIHARWELLWATRVLITVSVWHFSSSNSLVLWASFCFRLFWEGQFCSKRPKTRALMTSPVSWWPGEAPSASWQGRSWGPCCSTPAHSNGILWSLLWKNLAFQPSRIWLVLASLIGVSVCMYVCVCVCVWGGHMCVCIYVCVCICIYVCVRARIRVCVCVHSYTCICGVCVCVNMHVKAEGATHQTFGWQSLLALSPEQLNQKRQALQS